MKFLKDTKSRIILFIAVLVLIIGAFLIYLSVEKKKQADLAGAKLTGAPKIQSIPGVGETTQQYAQAVEQQNIEQAERAAKRGGSAVPTITQPTYRGPSEFGGERGSSKECSPDALRRARAAGVQIDELRCKGCTLADLTQAGYPVGELRDAGFTAPQLRQLGMDCQALLKAGYTFKEVQEAGYNQDELKTCFPKRAAPEQIPNFPKDCAPESLQRAYASGISAEDIKRVLSCEPAELKNAGYTAEQLKAAGYTAGQLKTAGFTASQLKQAGFSPSELRQAGLNAGQLKNAGFDENELREAGYSQGELVRAGVSPVLEQAKSAEDFFPKDCSPASLRQARLDGFSVEAVRKKLGCNSKDLVRAGYPAPTPSQPAQTTVEPAINTDVISPELQAQAEAARSLPAVQEDRRTRLLNELRERQAKELSDQQRQTMVRQLQQAMSTQAGDLLGTWAPPPTQAYVQAPEEKPEAQKAKTLQSSQMKMADGSIVDIDHIIKAGTVVFGVLQTGVNSDEVDTPVFATIVQGSLKGTKLLGKFKRVDQKVIVSFDKMNIPCLRNTVPVNLVAMDADKARTALASHVDNHYFLRYGTLFASSFASGLADAISNSGVITRTTAAGTEEEQRPRLNTREKVLTAVGEVGKQYASVLKKNFDVPPTVTVNAGKGIGILFMQDLAIPRCPDTEE